MRPVSAAWVLTALIQTVAIAQTAPQTPAAPPPSFTTPQQYPNQTTVPAGPSAGAGSQRNTGDTQTRANDCSSQIKAINPRLSAEQIRQYCQRQLTPSSPQD
jgi:hypothetical protein